LFLSKRPSGLQRFSTQKQALNAVAFFFKYVCGVKDPVFNVKLRKTGARVPVVLSKPETQRVFEKLERPEPRPENARKGQEREGRYGLAARLQYGAGLRLSELVRLTRSRPRARLALRAA